MKKIDFKKSMKDYFRPPSAGFVELDVDPMPFLKVDGQGDPNTASAYKTAVEWLYGVSYAMKFAAKTELDQDYVVPPLQGLWWANDPQSFVTRDKGKWHWTMMILVPDFVTHKMFEAALGKMLRKRADLPESLRMDTYQEGRCLQIMHIGSYDEEGPTLARLHDEIMPQKQLTFNGPHHEIYLSDPRKTSADRLKTVLRQPVRQISAPG